ncbi:prenylcysteine oxidase [Besnoitia besnoiti]|uniref:Prenylcysteine oxidase n=1 Tax=Besnoitia besnoiti TaxID=94643 RepID=A0A2A9MH61_BESBE|nr:prenylcysteine oxidase [Besnoitia besnoiti]PFH37239.1 prenylcysteine oxidase [Besnoitia besnoiti]
MVRLLKMSRGLVLSSKAHVSGVVCTLFCAFLSMGRVGFTSPVGVSSPSPIYPPFSDCSRSLAPARVAIVGGGITGVATAAFLRTLERDMADARHTGCGRRDLLSGGEQSGNRRFVIDLIEAGGRLGGRLDFEELDGAFVELGGSEIHATNEWMVHFHDAFNAHLSAKRGTVRAGGEISNRKAPKSVTPLVSPDIPILLHDGDNTTTISLDTTSEMENSMLSIGQAILHDLIAGWTRLYPLFKLQTCPDFSGKQYSIREGTSSVSAAPAANKKPTPLPAFHSAIEMLDAVGLSPLLEYRLEDVLNSLSPTPFVRNLIDALLRGVYTQGVSMHALAGAVSLAAQTGNLYAKERPGRELVTFLAETHVDHVFRSCRIQRIEERAPRQGEKYRKTFRLVTSDALCPPVTKAYLNTRAYDAVVIATPLEVADIAVLRRNKAGNLELLELPPPRKFQEIFVTVVAADGIQKDGLLNPTGGATLTTSRQRSSGSTENRDISLFAAWCGHSPSADLQNGQARRFICKLTSERSLTDDDVSHLFSGVHAIIRRKWPAYPFLIPIPRYPQDAGDDSSPQRERGLENDPTRFQLMENVFYPNAFEGAFSCMEGQAMAARNTAHLLWNALA